MAVFQGFPRLQTLQLTSRWLKPHTCSATVHKTVTGESLVLTNSTVLNQMARLCVSVCNIIHVHLVSESNPSQRIYQ